MEYVAGETLKERLQAAREAGERLSPTEVMNLLRGVAWALDYAHERAIVHRDVKPANILLRVDEGDAQGLGLAVLTDFGVAKIMEGAQLTSTGMTIGTPDYMSPEQSAGGEITPRADLYSLGVVLYEMAVGQLPFTADTPVAVLFKHMYDAPPSALLRAPDLPPAVDRVLQRALAKAPEDRFPTGAALVAAVERAWEGALGGKP
jgi:serine/threonine protein kinase